MVSRIYSEANVPHLGGKSILHQQSTYIDGFLQEHLQPYKTLRRWNIITHQYLYFLRQTSMAGYCSENCYSLERLPHLFRTIRLYIYTNALTCREGIEEYIVPKTIMMGRSAGSQSKLLLEKTDNLIS